MLRSIKGAIFDMDGTLVDSLMLWDVLWRKFGEKFMDGKDFKPSAEHDKAVRTMNLKDAMDFIHNTYRIGKDGSELLDAANEMARRFYSEEVELKDGVAEFLEYCRKKDIKMCVASATAPDLIELAVEHCGLGKYFTEILSCAGTGKGKDEPDIYLESVKALGVNMEDVCVFEDSCVAIETADKIGLKTVGIYDKYNYGHEQMKKIASEYIDDGETLLKLIGE